MSTGDVLAAMAASVVDQKIAAGAKLTPVGLERGATVIPQGIAASFPNDHPVEVVEEALKNIRREIATIFAAVEAVEAILGAPAPEAVAPDPVVIQKAREQAADARADARLAAKAEAIAAVKANMDIKAAEAQAATFKGQSPAEDGWQCPDHEQSLEKTSRLGRQYRVCPVDGCKEFEKL